MLNIHDISFFLQKMASVLESNGSKSGSPGFLDFKLKRKRLCEILTCSPHRVQIESDVQSNSSSESGYVSLTDGNHGDKGEGSNSAPEKQESPKFNESDGCAENRDSCRDNLKPEEVKDKKVSGEEMNVPKCSSALFLPPPYYSNNSEKMHIGVAYVSIPNSGDSQSENSDKNNRFKMGLVPVMSPMSGFIPLALNGLSSVSLPQELPNGIQPVFMTTMPNGFIMTSSGPVSLNTAVASPHKVQNDGKQRSGSTCSSDRSGPSSKKVQTKETESEFIEHYTNGSFVYLGHLGGSKHKLKNGSDNSGSGCNAGSERAHGEPAVAPAQTYDNKYPMVCGICNDKATGLHYGIITCEG